MRRRECLRREWDRWRNKGVRRVADAISVKWGRKI